MAIANNMKRAMEIVKTYGGPNPAKAKDKGGIGKRKVPGLASKIVPNNMSNVGIRKQNFQMAKGARQTNNAVA